MFFNNKKKLCRFILNYLVLFSLFPIQAQAAGRLQDVEDNVVVVIDPGHGGENEGTIENGFQEKSMTLKTAEAMYQALSQYDGVTVYMTRTDDRDMSLRDRALFAQEAGADFLFSIHYNASLNHNLFGSEVWVSAQEPWNAYGYQFGYTALTSMQDMGLFSRGIKTRLNDKGTDYYGIIREAAAIGLPAVIIEHCHVDEERDVPFCDTDEGLRAFGEADARAVAKYFGLSSSSLGTDYSDYPLSLPEVPSGGIAAGTLKDETPPEVCMVTLVDADYNTGNIRLTISAADYDSPLLYYDYSFDGGATYSPLQAWPGSDALTGAYTDTFSLDLNIPSGGSFPVITFRAYNMFDGFTESNELLLQVFRYGEEEKSQTEQEETAMETLPAMNPQGMEAMTTEEPSEPVVTNTGNVSILTFLKICLICAAILLILVLISQAVNACSRRKRHQSRKADGNKKNHNR